MVVVPLTRGMHLCERTVAEKAGNLTLSNAFRSMRADRFPAIAGPFVVYAHLVNGAGQMPFQLAISRLDRDETIYVAPGVLTFADRMREIRLSLSVGKCVVPAAGLYAVMLWANGELIAQTDFRVKSKSEA